METSLFKKGGKVYTRFKVSLKDFWKWKPYLKAKYNIDTDNPSKKSIRYIYFEKEGDSLNG